MSTETVNARQAARVCRILRSADVPEPLILRTLCTIAENIEDEKLGQLFALAGNGNGTARSMPAESVVPAQDAASNPWDRIKLLDAPRDIRRDRGRKNGDFERFAKRNPNAVRIKVL